MSTPFSLTAVVLSKNSEKTLSACLDSLSFADTIIVADDGSSDTTLDIAKRHKAKILPLTATSSFSTKRNQALAAVTTQWTLFVDSDEVVSSALQESIEAFIAVAPPTTAGALLQRDDIFLGRHLKYGETGSTWLLRLARTHSGTWKRNVHEVWKVEGRVESLSGILLHRSHTSITSFFDKIIGYTRIEAESRTTKKSPFLWLKTMIELVLFPPLKFGYTYVVKAGFRDGFPGFVMSYMMSMHSLWVRIQILEILRKR